MIEVRRSSERGFADRGWLKSFHTFSFADYHDAAYMSFGPLRVINEDRIAAGQGFGAHSHRDMEIISYVLDGALAHEDSLGNGSVIRPGDVQRMTAGTGVRHSEFNSLKDGVTHFLQIWIMPARIGLAPSYEEKHISVAERRGRLRLVASEDGRDDSLLVHQDAKLYGGLFDGSESASLPLDPARLGYIHLARGEVSVNGHSLKAGDGIKLVRESSVELANGEQAEVLVFDLPY